MKEKINTVVFHVTRKCNQICPHCFFNSSPYSKEELTLRETILGINDLKNAGIKEIKKFIISGGEPTLWPNLSKLINKIRLEYPLTKIRIDTNGLTLFQTPKLFDIFKADIYDISVDIFHNQGLINKNELFIKKSGSSPLLDFFLNQRKKYKFQLFVRWISDRNDNQLFRKFLNKYKSKVIIKKKFVTATGRGKLLPINIKSKGHLIADKPRNFSCLMGDSLILAINGYWYGCYYPVPFTKICKAGKPNFKKKLKQLTDSFIYKKLSQKRILDFLNYLKKKKPKYNKIINKIIQKRYWYRCQPCEEACRAKIFKKKYE